MKQYIEMVGIIAMFICLKNIVEETQKIYKKDLKRKKLIDYLRDILDGWQYVLLVIFILCNVLILITENEKKFKIIAILFLISILGWLGKNNIRNKQSQYKAFLIEIIAGMAWIVMLIISIYS